MNVADPIWLAVGMLAQVAFSARFLVQWVLSERARRSLLPLHFWYFSVLGGGLLLAYAAHQRDVVIALGQVVGLAIYLRNIELVRHAAYGRSIGFLWPWSGLVAAAVLVGLLGREAPVVPTAAARATPLWFALGLFGQALFTGRFVVQLQASERARGSVNPVQFWYLSLSGSVLLLTYALHTGDVVLILGQSFGLIVYLRNLALIRRQRVPDHHGEESGDEVTVASELDASLRNTPGNGSAQPSGSRKCSAV